MAEEDVVASIWHTLLAKLASDPRVTAQYMGFLSLIEPKGVLGDTIYLEVANDGTRNMIDQRLRPIIVEHLAAEAEVTGGPTNFALVVNAALNVSPEPVVDVANEWANTYESSLSAPVTPILPQATAPASAFAPVTEPYSAPVTPVTLSSAGLPVGPFGGSTSSSESNSGNHLNPNYTFDTYVIGESNRMAHAMALAVGEAPGKSYNPLFVYGNSGLGKTHLLHAIGHYALNLYPRIKVRYVSSEEFTNDFINAIQNNRTVEFQATYRDIDVLLIDDIQFLQGKDQTQEAFFHTFNTLHDHNKQVVITSDLPPKQLTGFEDRMLSRFEWGLLTDIQAPELETRIAILRKKAENDKLRVPDEVLEYMAARVSSNIRELEGTLLRVNAFAALNRQVVDMQLVQTVLKDVVPLGEDSVVAPIEIINAVSAYYKITPDDLYGQSRIAAIALARQIAMYICREQTNLSLPKIGQLFGNRDHTTVMYAQKKITEYMNERRYVYNQVTEIIGRIKAGQR